MTITRLNPHTIQLDITKEDWLSGYRSRAARRSKPAPSHRPYDSDAYRPCEHCAVARAAQKNGFGEVRVGEEGRVFLLSEEFSPAYLTRKSTRLKRLYEQFDEAHNTAALPEPVTLKLTLTRAGREYFKPAVQP